MLHRPDRASAAPDEPRTARMEQRTKPRVKARIRQAAALLGVDETAFVIGAALARADAVIAEHERTLLAAADREAFFAALDAPAEPTEALRAAARMRREALSRDG